MKPIRWSDLTRYPLPYVTAEQSRADGYLRGRFDAIRAQQAADAEERARIVAPLTQMRKVLK